MASGSWAEVPIATTLARLDPGQNASLNPNFPAIAPWDPNGIRHTGIVTAWCGAAFDESTDRYWLGVGGGHTDYFGNEVYSGTMNSESPTWAMVRKPSGSKGLAAVVFDNSVMNTAKYADGRPRAFHSYNGWVYVPGAGPVLTSGSGVGSPNAGGKRIWAFIQEADGETLFTTECTLYSSDYGGQPATCYDSRRHAIWFFPNNNSTLGVRYDIPTSGGANTGTFRSVGSTLDKLGYVSATYLPDDDCILLGMSNYAETAGSWAVIDCASEAVYRPVFSGSGAIGSTQGQGQPRWVASLGSACVWNNAGSTTLITRLVKPSNPRTGTWLIDTLPVIAANTVAPAAKTRNGTYGRFAYSRRMGGFLVFSATAGPTYFYKL